MLNCCDVAPTAKEWVYYLFSDLSNHCRFQEINAVLGEQLSAEDEEAVMAEFENLEAQVCPMKHLEFLSVEKQPKIVHFIQTRLKVSLWTRFMYHSSSLNPTLHIQILSLLGPNQRCLMQKKEAHELCVTT